VYPGKSAPDPHIEALGTQLGIMPTLLPRLVQDACIFERVFLMF
jgi:hypothetical protein